MTTIKSRLGRIILPLLPINRRTFDMLRHELRAIRTRLNNSLSPIARRRISRVSRLKELSVNLGSGGRGLQDWINIELRRAKDTTICLDIRGALPFAEGS